MSSFEWMELQTLTNDIDMSRSRLVEARKSGDQGRVGALEEEITRAEKRRLQLLAHISTNIVTAQEPRSKAKEGAGSRQAADAPEVAGKAEQPPAEAVHAPAPRSRAREGAGSRPAAAPAAEAPQGAATVDQPTPTGKAAGAAEAVPSPRVREGTGSRQASAAPAAVARDAVAPEKPPGEPASVPEPAPSQKASEAAAPRQVSAAPAEALPAAATVAQPDETASAPASAPAAKATEDAAPIQAPAPAAEALRHETSREQPLPDRVDRIAESGALSPVPKSKTASAEGGSIVWDQLTPADIERVKSELGTRRAEMLARHAEELKGLDAEQTQIETLEQAIEMFLLRAKSATPQNAAA